jgi:alkylation response protein AidB-like acyl-CoA dehydrogenase
VDFALSDEQEELRSVVRSFLDAHAPVPEAPRPDEAAPGYPPELWRTLVGELELTGLAIAEEYGGTGAGFVEVALVLEELGRVLLPVPYLATVTAASVVQEVAAPAVAGPILERIAAGAVATLALAEDGRALLAAGSGAIARAAPDGIVVDGCKEHVLDGAVAEIAVVSAVLGDELVLLAVDLASDGVRAEPLTTLDLTRPQARLRFSGAAAVRLTSPGTGEAALAYALALAWVALAAESAGAARSCLTSTVAYLGEREQFGRPIGSFQALKHRCADLAMEVEAATSTAYYASGAVAALPDELLVVAPLAKLYCARAFLHAAGEAIQLHGGIGFTWEHPAHLFFKRAKSTELLFGGPSELRNAIDARAGIFHQRPEGARR